MKTIEYRTQMADKRADGLQFVLENFSFNHLTTSGMKKLNKLLHKNNTKLRKINKKFKGLIKLN